MAYSFATVLMQICQWRYPGCTASGHAERCPQPNEAPRWQRKSAMTPEWVGADVAS